MKLSLLRSIGEKREKEFNKLGVYEAEDLVRFYPRAYLDLTERSSLKTAYHNDVVLIACEVTRLAPVNYASPRKIVRAFCAQDGFAFTAIWFNQPYVAQKLKAGEYLFYGRVQNKFGQVSLVNPTFESLDKNYRLKGIVPVYSLKGKLTQKLVRDAVKEALQRVNLQSVIPYPIIQKYDLPSLTKSFFDVHNPPDQRAKDLASERIALEEYFTLISAFKIIKGGKEEARTRRYGVTAGEVKGFADRFGFEFTDGQKRAVNDIFENLRAPTKMNRLLQGDVGSGKTAVALCGIFMAVKSGYTAAYLSPTEVLAMQNYHVLKKHFPEYEIGYLADFAKTVYLIAMYKDVEIERENVRVIRKMPVKIDGKMRVEKIVFSAAPTANMDKEVQVDGVFMLRESVSPAVLMEGLEMRDGHVVVTRDMQTNLQGCYAAGDCTGRPYQYAKAVGEGNVAAHAVSAFVSELKKKE